MGSPPTGAPNNAGLVDKNCIFRQFEKAPALCLTAKNLCPSATVIRVHDGAMTEEYVVSSTTLVIVEAC